MESITINVFEGKSGRESWKWGSLCGQWCYSAGHCGNAPGCWEMKMTAVEGRMESVLKLLEYEWEDLLFNCHPAGLASTVTSTQAGYREVRWQNCSVYGGQQICCPVPVLLVEEWSTKLYFLSLPISSGQQTWELKHEFLMLDHRPDGSHPRQNLTPLHCMRLIQQSIWSHNALGIGISI